MVDPIVFVVVTGVLAGLNMWQFWFWSRQNHRLIDKIMSRNYAEYVQSENLVKPSPRSRTQSNPNVDTSDPYLDELNALI